MSTTNGSGNGHGPHNNEDDDNIVSLPSLKERDRIRREAEKQVRKQQAAANPMFNLPDTVKYLCALLIGIQIISVILPNLFDWLVFNLGFTPAQFTGRDDFSPYTIVTPITHMFLHGGWLHLGMNVVMMAAFGTGIEKWMGALRMLIFLFACGLCGIALHFALHPFSTSPVIGISGGLSGFFAAILIMIQRGHLGGGGTQRILPFAILWVVISIAFGFLGAPGAGSIAWAAHVGGFIGGFGILKMMRV